MAILTYQRFYHRHGIRLAQQLPNPPISIYNELVLPKNSVFHWFGYDHSEKVGLDQSDQIAKTVERYIFAENVEAYNQEDVIGNPRNLPTLTATQTRNYFNENKKIKRLKIPLEDIKDERSLVVYNYGLLNDKYRYTGTTTKELDRWLNYHRTVYRTIASLAKHSDRQHFVEIDVPLVVPPLTALLVAKNGLDDQTILRLTTADDWQISEFFNLITDGYKAYIFKDIIDNKEAQRKINIIFKCGNEYTVLNLGTLFSFTGVEENQDTTGRMRIAKRFLKAMMFMRQGLTLGTDTSLGIAQGEIRKPLADELNAITKERDSDDGYEEDEGEGYIEKRVNVLVEGHDTDQVPSTDKYDPFNPTKKTLTTVTKQDIDELNKTDIKYNDTMDADIDSELAELETLEVNKSQDIGAYVAYVTPSRDPKLKIEARARTFAEVGLMTPAEVNRIKKIAEKVDTIPDPRGSGKPLVVAMQISKDELVVDEGVALVSDKVIGLTDKSMQYSTLNKFDKEYIDKTLDKDIAQMTLSLQKAGIMVLDYKVERVKDIVNDYEIYRIKVQPVGGRESTISFKLPKVTSEGTFTVGNTTSRMRKQRSDCPIRKVAPDEVALTSYYSKLFVTRTPRKQFNYTLWVGNEVAASAISEDGVENVLTDVKLNNVFNPEVIVPSVYSAIAMRVSSLKAHGIPFFFNVDDIEKNLGVPFNEGDARIAVGLGKKGLIYIDSDGVTYQNDAPTGTLEEFFGLDTSKQPIEFAEVKIFSKAVPIVLPLAYQLGLGNLIKTLGCKLTRMPVRSHYKMEWYEYAIVFSDEKLIFDKRDQQATLILSGLNRFGKELRAHSVYDLDTHGVYNNLMDSIKVPLRYLKEIPLMFDMWVDHITEEILIDMDEPTDLVGLFLRACELLLNDSHPEPNDMAFMRDRGYERLSGMVYSELITSLRKYSNKPVNRNSTFELHPEAVWYNILQDESVIISEQSNPIHACKEQEIVVYRGAGGRSTLSMTSKDRRFHRNALGVTSEASVDNGDVGTVIYTTFNPNYKNVRGMTDRTDIVNNLKPSELVSTSMLLSPGAENEDELIA